MINQIILFGNLEWVTHSENIQWNLKNNKANKCVKIIQYDINDNIIKKWNSIIEAANSLNGDQSLITKCCKGKRKTAYGFIWKYQEA